MTSGYIGLGTMGSAMVERLCATGSVPVVFDLDDAAVARASTSGATPAASCAAVAARADVISVCVPAASHVEAVVTEIASTATPATTLLIHSTVAPETMQWCATAAERWGGRAFDACVAGGSTAAAAGELVIFASLLAEMPSEARSLLSRYGSHVIDCGPIGAGSALKLGVNVMTYAQQAAAKTAFAMVDGVGGSTDALVAAWKHIGQLGALTEQFLPVLGIPAEHIVGDFRRSLASTVAIEQKDLQLAAELAPLGLRAVPMTLYDVIPTVFNLSEET